MEIVQFALYWQSERMCLISLRGKHGKHKKVDDEIKDSVRKHISLIPSVESHYTREHTTRRFIDGSKTTAEIYRDYVNDRNEINRPIANYVMFYRIFTEEFNISFFNPKKDRCETCVAFENATGEEKENLNPKYENHLKEKDLSRKEKERDKGRASETLLINLFSLLEVPKRLALPI
ncbi:hypothetical protein NQ314_015431 [Rhamnusium bicolor]|uniref:Uncharacterized protein n=1 Tax=Rhamnusium bicolor TaxID=1586634 RepID=A0AAV8WYT3_9CUCU|nr:hypothetical protein NQ314_015431 [Rhamnusium bicolor]